MEIVTKALCSQDEILKFLRKVLNALFDATQSTEARVYDSEGLFGIYSRKAIKVLMDDVTSLDDMVSITIGNMRIVIVETISDHTRSPALIIEAIHLPNEGIPPLERT